MFWFRVNPQNFVAYSAYGRRISILPRLRTLIKVGQFGEWGLYCMVKVRRLQAGCVQYEKATARFNRRAAACRAKLVGSK
jgi:hypothetical protein